MKKQFKIWFDNETINKFEVNINSNSSLLVSLNNVKNLKAKFDASNTKINTIKKSIYNLKSDYDSIDYIELKSKTFEQDISSTAEKYYINKNNFYKINSLDNFKQDLKNNYNNINKIEIDTLKEQYSQSSFNRISIDLKNLISGKYYSYDSENYYFRNLETLKREITNNFGLNKLIEENEEREKILAKEISSFIDEYLKYVIKNNPDINSYKIKNALNANSFSVSTPQQIQISAQIQTAQAQTGSSGISIPSQSQMIEAMAIFLAKRAKQEAAIWFMDQIRLKMSNPMILDVFPETIKVMEGVENYKVPTFNTTWKYAIAKDFVEMPRNLVSSPWVEKVIVKDPISHARLKQSIDFGYDLNRLMTEQYNYRDIIKYFYINPRLEMEKDGKDKINQDINRLIDNSTSLLYIITNEFFSIDNIDGKDVYRLLSYEEISSLNEQEFRILLELIDFKYSEKLNSFEIIKNLKFENREKINSWMGNILISLSQFDKIRNEYKSKKEEIKDDLASKNFYNVWSTLNQLTKNLYNEKLFHSAKIENLQNKIEWVQKGMSVYEHFQNNDYVGAANEAIGLIDIIKQNTSNSRESKEYFYDFGKNKKISVSYTFDKTSLFKVRRINNIKENNTSNNTINYNKDFIIFSFENNNVKYKINDSSEWSNISSDEVNEFLTLAKYTAKNNRNSIELLETLLAKDVSKAKSALKMISDTLKIDQVQLIRLVSYIKIAENAEKTQNMDEALKKVDFNFVKNESLNIVNIYNNKYTKQLTNLLSFFGDVITVKDEHQLAGIIDSYALPPTSYKLKRKQPSSIDLNAYVGAFGGGLMSLKSTTIDSQPVYGITAPIGVAFTWSRNGWYDNYGFTVDVVDLGNVVNHYLVKPGEDYAKDIHFSEVFSLGTTFLMGIKNSPFVISGGFRFQPYNTGKDTNNKVFDAGIFHLGVKIDIPLIHLSGKDF